MGNLIGYYYKKKLKSEQTSKICGNQEKNKSGQKAALKQSDCYGYYILKNAPYCCE